jgi:hypothetical protein
MLHTLRSIIRNFGRLRLGRRQLMALAGGLAVPHHAAAQRDEGTQVEDRVWASFFRTKNVWAHVNKHSVEPGESFELLLSTGPGRAQITGRVELFRFTRLGDDQKEPPVWTSASVRVAGQRVLRTAAAIGTDWQLAFPAIDTAGWPPGYYSADFVEDVTEVRDLQIAQIIVRNPARSGKVLLKLCTNTYQAYNEWGGHSLYPNDSDTRGAIVSFDRPTSPAFFEYDAYLAQWLEDLGRRYGFSVDYASNFDVHRDPDMLAAYDLVACGAHDEYWSKEEFDAFEHRIFSAGKNAIFFGANTAYFQVRYADVNRPRDGQEMGRQLICHKSIDDPIARRVSGTDGQLLITARFRDNARRPENMLIGVAYQDWFSPDLGGVPYYVASTDAPFFAGTGYEVGDMAADVLGYEWDNRDPARDGRRLFAEGRSLIRPIPADHLKVLFRGSASGESTQHGIAEAVYFESSAGARVFSSGTIRWCWGLGKPGFVREPFKRFNENLVRAFLRI